MVVVPLKDHRCLKAFGAEGYSNTTGFARVYGPSQPPISEIENDRKSREEEAVKLPKNASIGIFTFEFGV